MQSDAGTNGQRSMRFAASTVLIGMVGYAIIALSASEGVPLFLPMGLYFGHLIFSGFLLAMIAGRLFRQHELREFNVDIATLLLATSLFALPLGVSNGFLWIIQQFSNEIDAKETLFMMIIIAGLLYFLMFPSLFIVEAAMAWWLKR